MTTLELSAVEVANLPTEGTFWIVREGERDVKAEAMNHALAVELFARPDLRWPESSPPAVFTQACAPCETCGDARRRTVRDLSGVETFGVPCPYCRIELVGPCPTCKGDPSWPCGSCGRPDFGGNVGTVHVGWAYAVGRPCLIDMVLTMRRVAIGDIDDATEVVIALDGLVYAGPPESLVGRYAQELRRA